jgi:hypothetical protein
MNSMSDIKLKRFEYFKLKGSFGLGVDIARDDFWEYDWWECEIHITLGRYYLTVRINRHV